MKDRLEPEAGIARLLGGADGVDGSRPAKAREDTREDTAEDSEALPALDDVRARICADLDARQGGWQRAGLVTRAWPVALAALAGSAFILALSPASLSLPLAIACVLAGAAAAVALSSILVCPSKPGRGERLAQVALGLGALALAVQAVGGLSGEGPGLVRSLAGALRCGGVFVVGGAVPLLLLGWMLRRSGLPVRKLHAAALAVAAFALSGLGVWRHCAPPSGWHVALAHLALPAAVTALAAAAVFWLLARRRASP